MSDAVREDGRVISSVGLDFMIFHHHNFELAPKIIGQPALLVKTG
jgi:hypothetical protein